MSQPIRVTCASLCRIEHDAHFLLLLNADRLAREMYVLSPVGGALEFYDRDTLAAFDAEFENPDNNDLRFSLPQAALPAFREWFYTGQGRERSPYRELREELVDETGLLPSLAPAEVAIDHLWTVEPEARTMRQGQTGVLTHYFLEVYAVRFATAVLESLLASPADGGAVWVTAGQIMAGEPLPVRVAGELRRARVRGYYLLHSTPPE